MDREGLNAKEINSQSWGHPAEKGAQSLGSPQLQRWESHWGATWPSSPHLRLDLPKSKYAFFICLFLRGFFSAMSRTGLDFGRGCMTSCGITDGFDDEDGDDFAFALDLGIMTASIKSTGLGGNFLGKTTLGTCFMAVTGVGGAGAGLCS